MEDDMPRNLKFLIKYIQEKTIPKVNVQTYRGGHCATKIVIANTIR